MCLSVKIIESDGRSLDSDWLLRDILLTALKIKTRHFMSRTFVAFAVASVGKLCRVFCSVVRLPLSKLRLVYENGEVV